VSVQDFGAGIGAESQPHVFERFYRAPDEQQLAVHGLGLGLYVSAEIIRRHGGTIGVESMPGVGSIFHFSLPIQSSEDTLAELGSILSEELAHGA
jgi:two-component system, sensor histidine kinase and response regulator